MSLLFILNFFIIKIVNTYEFLIFFIIPNLISKNELINKIQKGTGKVI